MTSVLQPTRASQIQTDHTSEAVAVSDFLNVVRHIRDIEQVINGGITFGDGTPFSQAGNLAGQILKYKFSAPGTTYKIPHGLGKTPVFAFPALCDAGLVVYDPLLGANWSPRFIELRSSAVGTALLLVL